MAVLHGASGTWIPAVVPRSSRLIAILLVLCSIVTSTVSSTQYRRSITDIRTDVWLRWVHGVS